MLNSFLRLFPRPRLLSLLLAAGSLPALAQPTVTGLNPTRNQRSAPRATNVALTFSQAISASTASNLRVHSLQRGGQLVRAGGGNISGGNSTTITFDPANDFRPGENLFVTAPPSMLSTGGQAVVKQVYQFTAATGGTGPGTFQAPATNASIAVGNGPAGVVAADVNGDGNIDLLTADGTSNTVSVRLGNGSGGFSSGATVSVGNGPYTLAVGDLDNDGDLDLLVPGFGDGTIRVLLNNGSASFSPTSAVSLGSANVNPLGIAVADLNADGMLDFVTSNNGDHTLSVLLGAGNGTFTKTLLPLVDSNGRLTLADIDNDGDIDILATDQDGSGNGTISIFRNNGLSTISFAARTTLNVGGYASDVQTADVDGDGDRDLLVADRTNNKVLVRLNNGSGTFSGGSDVAVDDSPELLRVADVNADGFLDVLTGSYYNNYVSVRLNSGTGTFSGQYRVTVGNQSYGLALADIDSDGDLDLLTTNDNNAVAVRLNRPFPSVTAIAPGTAPRGATVTLTGTRFTGATAVTFNGTAAAFTVNSATQITATVPAGAGSGPVIVTTPEGFSDAFSFTVTFPVTSLSPARNANAAPRATNVSLTYGQPIAAATANNVRVYSAQRGGRLVGGNVTVSGGTITVNPAQDFRPGERIFVTAPGSIQSTNGLSVIPQVYQFTAAVGGSGRGTFVAPAGGAVGIEANSNNARAADVDGDGDLDLLVASYSTSSVSVLLNNGLAGFSSGGTVTVGTNPLSLAVGDVDGNGTLDFVTADNGTNTVSVRLNNGTGAFTSAGTVSVGPSAYSVALGDLDADGDLDLLCANFLGGVSVIFNDGSGNFSATGVVNAGFRPNSLVTGDVDNDGDLDFVATTSTRATVLQNDGAGNFTNIATLTVGSGPTDPVLADINGNGTLDLLVTNGSSGTVSVFLNTAGTFALSATLTVGANPNGTQAIDLDADGDLDLLTANFGDNTVTRLINEGNGTFSNATTVAVGTSPIDLVTADLDADGDLDFATVNSADNTVSIRLNATLPTLTSITPSSSPVGRVLTLTGADFTGVTGVSFNGTPATSFTLVSPTQITVTVPAGATTGNVTVITPQGTSNGLLFTQTMGIVSLTPARNAIAAPRPTNVGITFDQPVASATAGNARVFSAQRGGQLVRGGNATVSGSTLTVNPANDLKAGETVFVTLPATVKGTSGASAEPQVYQFTAAAGGSGQGTQFTRTDAGTGASPRAVTPADVDGDGDLDLLVVNESDNSVSVMDNDGTGAINTVRAVPVGSSPKTIAAADVDGDGDLDILVANEAGNSVSVRLNDGAGTFSGSTNVAVGRSPWGVAAADVDADGDLDLLVSNAADNNVSIRLNNGTGTFSGTAAVSVSDDPKAIAVGDVDRDGDLDLLSVNHFGNNISVRLNDGAGNFGGGSDVGTANNCYDLAVADVNNDGYIDLLAASYSNYVVSVRLNDGTGNFGGGSDVPVGTQPTGVTTADIDADGDLDILALNHGAFPSSVSVRFNNGAGVFSGTTNVSVGVNAWGVAAGDMDGDGDLDILTANQSSYSATVLRNVLLPTLTSIAPTAVVFGQSVTLTGTAFTGATAVTFNGMPAASFTVSSATSITAVVPTGATNGNVTVTTPDGTSNGVAFTRRLPTLTSASPNTGTVGTSVTLTGTDLNRVTAVSFNGTAATGFTATSATSLTVLVPAGATTGNLTVTTPEGTSNGVAFTVTSTLVITSLNPARNAVAAPRTTNVGITFNKPIDPATAGAVRVQSQQRGGQLVRGGNATAGGNTITVNPAQDLRAGETVFVTVPNGVQSTIGERVNPQVYQFTAATGGTGVGEFRGGADYSGTNRPRSVTTADIDGDGDLDMLTPSEASGNVSIRRNDGTGVFGAATILPVGNNPENVVATDLDNDGDLDLLVSSAYSGRIDVFFNTGTGTFVGGGNVSITGTLWMVAAADVDADGDPDMLILNQTNSTVSVRLNNGAGTFSGGSTVSVGATPWGLAVGDMDNDGDLDLVTANNAFPGSVSVRFNDGSGTFSGTTNVPVNSPIGVTLGDVDNDGDLDVLTAGESTGVVGVRLNTGNGTLSGGSDLPMGADIDAVAVGDLDADGDLDMAAGNYNGSTVSVRFNEGSGVFGAVADVPVSSGPWGVTLADLDGDLDLDLLAACYNNNNTVSVRFNQPTLRGTVVISSTAANSTATSPIPVRVLFNERVTGFVAGDVTVGNGVVTGGSFSGSGRLYTFSVTPAAPGLVTVDIPAGVAQDSAGGNNLAAAQFSILYAPVTVTAITRNDPSPAATAGVSYTVTFSGAVTGLSTSNFSVTTTGGLTGARVSSVSGSGTTYVVTVSTGTGDGTLRLDLANGAGVAPTIVAPYTSGPAYTINRTLTSATLSIQGTGGTGDVTAFVDAVQLLDATTNAPLSGAVANFSFETHDPLANGDYGYAPTGASWTFNSQSGIARNGSAFSPPTTPNGVAVAFVQDLGQIGQVLTPSAGNVKLTFQAGQRDCCGGANQTLNVFVDGVFVGRIQPANNNAYTTFTSGAFTVPVPVTDLTVTTTGQTIPGGTYRNITITGTGEATLGGDITVTGALVIQDGGLLDDGCHVITGAGSFTLLAGGTLAICDPAGITGSGPTGAVRVSGARAFAADASYRYTGTAAQVTGAGLPAVVRALEVSSLTNATVTLTQATAVTRVLRLTAGTLTPNGHTLTLLSTAAGTAYAVHTGGLTNGPVTVQRYVNGPTALSYHHLSSPVQAAPVSDLATTGFVPKVNPAYNNLPYVAPSAASFPNVFGFDETRGSTTAAYQDFTIGYYSPAALGTTLTPGRGYSVYIGGGKTPDFVGTLTTGSLNVPLSHTGINTASNKAGWQLLGNPYPQPIDWDLLTTPANVEASVYVWYSTGGVNGVYRVRNASGVGNLTNGVIGLGQGFWVRTTAPATFAFTNALRVEDLAVPLGRAVANNAAQRPLLTLTLGRTGAPNGQQDEVTIYEQAGATAGFDGAFDAVRPGHNVGVPTLSALIGLEEAMISAVPEASLVAGTTMDLLLDLPAAGSYSFGVGELTHLDEVTLLDRATGTQYDLATQPVVTFQSSAAGELRGRFALVFGQRPTGTSADAAALSFTMVPNPAHGAVRLHHAVAETATLLDATGRTVRTWTLAPGTTADLSLVGLAPGVYSVRVGTASRRLVIE